MKITDEKGRLFGKINVIDLLALIVLIAALVFVAVKFLLPSGEDLINGSSRLTYTTTVTNVEPAVYEEVCRQLELAGGKDQLMANGELLPAYVTAVSAVPHVSYAGDAEGNMVRSVEDFEGGRLDVTFTVEAQVADPVVSKVGTQEVRVGKNHIMKTTHFEFAYSTIITCDWE